MDVALYRPYLGHERSVGYDFKPYVFKSSVRYLISILNHFTVVLAIVFTVSATLKMSTMMMMMMMMMIKVILISDHFLRFDFGHDFKSIKLS